MLCSRTLVIPLLAGLLLCAGGAATAWGHGEDEGLAVVPPVRVGLVEGAASAICGIQGGPGLLIDPASGDVLREVAVTDELRFTPSGDEIKVDRWTLPAIRLESGVEGAHVTLAGHPYRGAIEIHSWQGKLVIVNHCTLDEYLYGVVPGEMPSGWHHEALKAQAVAARTYAVRSMGQYEHGLYDLKPTIYDQVYNGVRVERVTTNDAIDATSGLVLTYDGEPITAYFHSSSGEATVNGSAMRGAKSDLPYLRGVPSREGEIKRWFVTVTPEELRGVLTKKGYTCGKVSDVYECGHDAGLIAVVNESGTLELPRNYLRSFLGSDRFRSANFKVEIEPGGEKINFIGTGWGHGVGMSQFGAKGYAEEGWDYRQILLHYYRGVTLSFWYDIS